MSGMAIYRQLEPVIVHLRKKRALDRIARRGTDYRINAALRAKGCVVIVGPIFNLGRRKNFQK
jgi:hypothetical protein